jgi:hypothetical protein
MPKNILNKVIIKADDIETDTISANDVTSNRSFIQYMPLKQELLNNNNVTYTSSEIMNGMIERSVNTPSGNVIDVLPSATSLISEYNLKTGDSFNFNIRIDNSSSSYTWALYAGAGGTARTFVTVAASGKVFISYIVLITSSTTYNVYRIPTTSAF